MKITILTTYFYPEITAGTHLLKDLAYDFSKYGAKTTVVSCMPKRGISGGDNKDFESLENERINENLQIIRIGKCYRNKGYGFLLRSIIYLYESSLIYLKAKEIETDIYLISSTPPFLGIVGALLSTNNKTVYNLQDIFPDSLINAGKISQKNIMLKFLKSFEKLVYQKNDHIITISKDFAFLLENRGVQKSKISIVNNWIDDEKVFSIPRMDNILIDKYKLDRDKFYITYCGNIGYSQNLEMVIDVAKDLELSYPDIRFVFIGDGAWKKNIDLYIESKLARTVSILPFQQYSDISHVMSLGNISLVCSKANVSSSSVPSKTWSIMAASRPVICSFDLNSELCDIVQKAKCGICVPPADREKLKSAIIYLYLNDDVIASFGKNGRKYVEKYLSRNNATRHYFEILSKVSRTSSM